MRATRPAVTPASAAAVILCLCTGCADDPCFQPRAADTTECLVVDGGLSFSRNMPMDEATVHAMCDAPCVDVSGTVEIDGYDRLVDVPGLSKVRQLGGLAIHIATLQNLKGLEHVDVQGGLYLLNRSGEENRFTSLEGFTDDALIGLTLDGLRAATYDLNSLGLRQLDRLTLRYSHVDAVEATGWRLKSIFARGCDELHTVSLDAAQMESVDLNGNEKLETLIWPDELVVTRKVTITNNTALSTCVASNFVNETTQPNTIVMTSGNGPCR